MTLLHIKSIQTYIVNLQFTFPIIMFPAAKNVIIITLSIGFSIYEIQVEHKVLITYLQSLIKKKSVITKIETILFSFLLLTY